MSQKIYIRHVLHSQYAILHTRRSVVDENSSIYIISAVIPIIAIAGKAIFAGANIEPDSYVLSLAVFSESVLLQVIVFVGGLSAATAMIIVATLTLSTMLTNDVILPRILAFTGNTDDKQDVSSKIRLIRRIVIAFILLMAFLYHQQMTSSRSLHSIGLIAFSLVIQLMPAIVGGLYWKRAHAPARLLDWVGRYHAWVRGG